ncbi:MAG: hypothetical protein KAK00_01050 [Nanoarchaeota archaeon]|nr:hypothetical protein [Nanoarchaeota archaeon]
MERKNIIALLIIIAIFLPAVYAQEHTCAAYITGIGCPACAQEDPIILGILPKENPDFVVIEYEIYKQRENGQVVMNYKDNYNSGLHIPLIVFGKEDFSIGVGPVRQHALNAIEKGQNNCPLPNGALIAFNELDLTVLTGKPKIWKGERILIKTGEGGDDKLLKNLLTSENLSAVVEDVEFEVIDSEPVLLSGDKVEFDNAIKIAGWTFKWNGEAIKSVAANAATEEQQVEPQQQESEQEQKGLGFYKVFFLALADTVNPCALAVFILFLIGIMSYDPTKGKKVLTAGAAFVTAVYICYFIYGLIIIKFWQIVQALTSVRLILYTILGVVSIVLGLLHFKDFLWYKKGGLATEMPAGWRGKVKRMMLGITSAKGAFLMGAFVTLFLMPCTMGPYLIAGGILSALELVKAIPWLIVYNLIFILPLYGIVLIVYFGFKKVEDISGWKDRNIRYLHLVIAILMLFIGVAILLGWI